MENWTVGGDIWQMSGMVTAGDLRSTLGLAAAPSVGKGPRVSLVELIPDMADTLSPLRERDLKRRIFLRIEFKFAKWHQYISKSTES